MLLLLAWAPLSLHVFRMAKDETLADLIKPLSVTKAASIIKKKGRFMAFVASYCYKRFASGFLRAVFFNVIAKRYKVPDALSNCKPRLWRYGGHRIPEKYLLRTHWEPDKPDGPKRAMRELVKVYSSYKFVITFENSRFDGYFTEKMISAVLAKAIPVYFGDPSITRWINPKAIVLCDVDTSGVQWDRIPQLSDLEKENYILSTLRNGAFDDCSARIEYLDQNETAAAETLAAPSFAAGTSFRVRSDPKHTQSSLERL